MNKEKKMNKKKKKKKKKMNKKKKKEMNKKKKMKMNKKKKKKKMNKKEKKKMKKREKKKKKKKKMAKKKYKIQNMKDIREPQWVLLIIKFQVDLVKWFNQTYRHVLKMMAKVRTLKSLLAETRCVQKENEKKAITENISTDSAKNELNKSDNQPNISLTSDNLTDQQTDQMVPTDIVFEECQESEAESKYADEQKVRCDIWVALNIPN